jgi:hypothetical protein
MVSVTSRVIPFAKPLLALFSGLMHQRSRASLMHRTRCPTGRKTLLIRGRGAHRKIVPSSIAPHTAAAREATAPDGDPARAFQSVFASRSDKIVLRAAGRLDLAPITRAGTDRRDGHDEVAFCACCARPICSGAVIRGEEICCSVECALENADRTSRPA